MSSKLELIESQPIEVIYPDSDGELMADNTAHWNLIARIKQNLELLYYYCPVIVVAGDLLWYPVQGSSNIKIAPDVMVVFGRPKGYRGSYIQHLENNIPVTIAFEILSPGNTLVEMNRKFRFYEEYGILEYYVYDQPGNNLRGFIRNNDRLEPIDQINGWISPLLDIQFVLTPTDWQIIRPDGQAFFTFEQLEQERLSALDLVQVAVQQVEVERLAKEQAEVERLAKEQAEQQAQIERLAKITAEEKIKALEARLKSMGIDI